MEVLKTKNMDLFNKVHIFELMKSHIYEPNISLISLFSLMLNYAKPRISYRANQLTMFFKQKLKYQFETGAIMYMNYTELSIY